MSYDFRVSSVGGSFGWIRWKNTIPSCTLPKWLHRYPLKTWGSVRWDNTVESEKRFRELVQITEELGLYD
jgi:hypothetical protein